MLCLYSTGTTVVVVVVAGVVVTVVVVVVAGGGDGIIFMLLENDFAPNVPFACTTSLILQNPAALVVTFPFCKVQEPETDQIFLPVELVEAIDEVAYLVEGSNWGIAGFA